jgi:hypothetical protein
MKLCQQNTRNTQNLEVGEKRNGFPPSASFRVFRVFRWPHIWGSQRAHLEGAKATIRQTESTPPHLQISGSSPQFVGDFG